MVSARGAYNQPRPNNIAYVNSRVNYTTNGSKGVVLDNEKFGEMWFAKAQAFAALDPAEKAALAAELFEHVGAKR